MRSTLSLWHIPFLHTQFTLFSQTVENSFRFNVHEIFEASRSVGRAVTTSAMTAKPAESFPYVTVPAFEARAYEARIKGGFEMITYAPVATNLQEWINFSTSHIDWYQESKEMFDQLEPGLNRTEETPLQSIPPVVYRLNNDGLGKAWEDNRLFCPSVHTSPPPLASAKAIMNVDFFSHPEILAVSLAAEKLKDAVFSSFNYKIGFLQDLMGTAVDHGRTHAENEGTADVPHPQSISAQAVFQGLSDDQLFAVGYIFTIISWDKYLINLLPQGVHGIVVVLKSSCGDSVTYVLEGKEAIFVGLGDMHEEGYTKSKKTIMFSDYYIDSELANKTKGHCVMYLDVYSSAEFEDSHKSKLPWIFTLVIAVLFFCMAMVFVFYNRCVHIRNQKVLNAAARSSALIRSLFPSNVHERLFSAQAASQGISSKTKTSNSNNNNGKKVAESKPQYPVSLKRYFDDGGADDNHNIIDMDDDDSDMFKSKPIADLFPETTIMFADIAGFTAWSSVREPSQVFTLLETLYHAFDELAKRRRVFKVETIGDCYVAVCGLPDPRKDHASTCSVPKKS